MKENENIRRMSSADLIELLDDEDCSEEERSAAVEAIKERAAKVGVGFVRYVQDTKDGKQPRQPVPFVKFASGGDGVGAECSAYLMRPDILEYVELPLALVEAVLKKLAKKDPEVGKVERADMEVLDLVRDVWRPLAKEDMKRGRYNVRAGRTSH